MRLDDLHSLELARPSDANVIAAGTLESIRPSQRRLVLATSPKYPRYVRYLLDHAALEPDRRHYVIKSKSDVVGYIDLRRTSSSPHLNHIWITSSRRGTGVGTSALRAALARCSPGSTFDLNVVADNSALGWYEKLGMGVDHVDRWYVRSALPSSPVVPRSAHMVTASLSLFGIATAYHPSTGEHVDLLEPGTLKVSLGADSQRGLTNTADGIAATYPAFSHVAEHVRDYANKSTESRGAQLVSVRMSAPLNDVVANLAV